MKIKNTKTLIERADWHAEFDHISQGTYGSATTDGKGVQFHGCAVACFSAPVGEEALRAYIEERGYQHANPNGDGGFMYSFDEENYEKILMEQFGICHNLRWAIEGVFENLEYNGAAINWLRDVAHALPEGVDITDLMVEEKDEEIRDQHVERMRSGRRGLRTEDRAPLWLEWLRSMKLPEPPAKTRKSVPRHIGEQRRRDTARSAQYDETFRLTPEVD